jgi:hypothetical protein
VTFCDIFVHRITEKDTSCTEISATLGCVQALVIRDGFISTTACRATLEVINDFRRQVSLPIITRPSAPRPLCYSVIDGYQILASLPQIRRLHEKTTSVIKQMFGDRVEPLADEQVACNINITHPGGSYRYHYDRNAVTAILYLNETSGGETECYPNHRLQVRSTELQRRIDRVFTNEAFRWIFAKQVLVRPKIGRLLIMRGNLCLHSVREVSGSTHRINIVMSYDVAGARYANGDRLNSYLYNPNYSSR